MGRGGYVRSTSVRTGTVSVTVTSGGLEVVFCACVVAFPLPVVVAAVTFPVVVVALMREVLVVGIDVVVVFRRTGGCGMVGLPGVVVDCVMLLFAVFSMS